MYFQIFETEVYRGVEDGFGEMRNRRVLIYWPHGFGDWVFLSYILPVLEPSNRYFVTRYGDDNSSVFDGSEWAAPLYAGVNSTQCGDGADFGNSHFGLRAHTQGSRLWRLEMPLALHSECTRAGVDAVLDAPFPEIQGRAAHPFHSKARNRLKQLVSAQRLASFDLNQSLACGLNFSAPEFVQKWVETRLRNFAGWRGQKLGLIARNGYTAVGKNWGHRWREDLPRERRHEGQECRDFLRLMHAHDRNWLWIVIEDRLFSGEDTVRDHALHCLSYAELFGETGSGAIPFGLVMKALVHLAEIAIGVPTGPYHLAMAKPGLPVVGLWTEHVPDWYDEPKAESRHLFSRNLLDSGALDRPASVSNFVKPSFQTTQLQTRFIPGEAVFAAVLDLLGNRTGPGMAPASTTVKAAPLHKGTGRFIAVTIGVGEKYQLLARLAAESCQRQTGLETVILGEEDMLAEQFTRSHFLKFSLFDRFPDVENILFFDADTLFLRRFDPWVFEACESVVAVRDHENADWIKADAKRAGIAASEYFNSGFFIVNRTHHSKMLLLAARLANEIDTPLHDQGPLNAARARLGIAVHWLDRAFNHLSFDGSKESERVVLAHFNGIANQSLEEIEKTYAFWRRHSEERKVPNV